jgi:hypothetical protein
MCIKPCTATPPSPRRPSRSSSPTEIRWRLPEIDHPDSGGIAAQRRHGHGFIRNLLPSPQRSALHGGQCCQLLPGGRIRKCAAGHGVRAGCDSLDAHGQQVRVCIKPTLYIQQCVLNPLSLWCACVLNPPLHSYGCARPTGTCRSGRITQKSVCLFICLFIIKYVFLS